MVSRATKWRKKNPERARQHADAGVAARRAYKEANRERLAEAERNRRLRLKRIAFLQLLEAQIQKEKRAYELRALWSKNNREKMRAYWKRWQEANREKKLKAQRDCYYRNKEKHALYAKRYYALKREELKAKSRLSYKPKSKWWQCQLFLESGSISHFDKHELGFDPVPCTRYVVDGKAFEFEGNDIEGHAKQLRRKEPFFQKHKNDSHSEN